MPVPGQFLGRPSCHSCFDNRQRSQSWAPAPPVWHRTSDRLQHRGGHFWVTFVAKVVWLKMVIPKITVLNRKRWEKHASPLEFTIKFWGEIPIIVKPKWFPVHGFKKPSDTTTKNQLIYHWNATPRHHERDQKPGPVGQTSLFQMGLWIVAVDVHHHLAGVHKSLGKSPYCVICMFRHTSLFPFSNMLSLPTSSDISIMCLGRVFRLHLLFLLP